LRILALFAAFTMAVSLLDYAVVMFYPQEVFPYSLVYQFLISILGYLSTAAYYLATRDKRTAVTLIPVFAIGKYLAEHMFFVWLDLIGDLRQVYPWYTHNPLNPNGEWGYNWTVLGVEGTMFSLALIIAGYYLPGYVIARRLLMRSQLSEATSITRLTNGESQ
jgi:magnesium-transporting ATPase (P-type)